MAHKYTLLGMFRLHTICTTVLACQYFITALCHWTINSDQYLHTHFKLIMFLSFFNTYSLYTITTSFLHQICPLPTTYRKTSTLLRDEQFIFPSQQTTFSFPANGLMTKAIQSYSRRVFVPANEACVSVQLAAQVTVQAKHQVPHLMPYLRPQKCHLQHQALSKRHNGQLFSKTIPYTSPSPFASFPSSAFFSHFFTKVTKDKSRIQKNFFPSLQSNYKLAAECRAIRSQNAKFNDRSQ